MRDAFIVTSIRTPGCRRGKGAFKDTRPEALLSFILKTAVERTEGLDPREIEDVMIGCAFPEARQGLNVGRNGCQIAGLPDQVGGATVSRFCGSGLEAIAVSSLKIMAGWADVAVGGGVESMTSFPMGGHVFRPDPDFTADQPDLYLAMGLTAENVARRYRISREDQDEFALHSQMKAATAMENGLFKEIVPTPAVKFASQADGTYRREIFIQDFDDGIRPGTTIESLSKLKPAFALGGTVTAGNSSQATDGAAAAVIMSGEKVKDLGLKPIARLRYYTTIGCRADEMGVGPIYAIPKLLKMAGLELGDIGLWEINEAFASQVLYCIRELGIDRYMERVNVYGGAIALGHPLGCTGAKLCAQLVHRMNERGVQFGVESMCIGGGMGAAALFELCH
jgi:acetyl-CoA acyltransferase